MGGAPVSSGDCGINARTCVCGMTRQDMDGYSHESPEPIKSTDTGLTAYNSTV